MTGMLARLSARVGGLEGAPSGALRPRSASVFEQAQSAWDADDAVSEDDAVAAVDAPTPPSRTRPRPVEGDVPPISPNLPLRASALERPDRPDRPEPDPGDRRPLRAAPDGASGRPPNDGPARPPAATVVERVVEVEVSARPEDAPRPHPAVADRAGPGGPAFRSAPVERIGPAVSASRAPGRIAPPQLRPATPPPVAPPSRRVEAGPSAPQTEPVVHVTIGRVEVRAVDAHGARPAPPRRAGSPAVTTLEAYLRRRARDEA